MTNSDNLIVYLIEKLAELQTASIRGDNRTAETITQLIIHETEQRVFKDRIETHIQARKALSESKNMFTYYSDEITRLRSYLDVEPQEAHHNNGSCGKKIETTESRD